MFRSTEDPSSGSLVQCLVNNYKNDSNASVGMDMPSYRVNYIHEKRDNSCVILHYICFYFPFHVILAVNLSLKRTAIVISNYSHNMLP